MDKHKQGAAELSLEWAADAIVEGEELCQGCRGYDCVELHQAEDCPELRAEAELRCGEIRAIGGRLYFCFKNGLDFRAMYPTCEMREEACKSHDSQVAPEP